MEKSNVLKDQLFSYKGYACMEPWNAEVDIIQSEMTLYAGWEKTT